VQLPRLPWPALIVTLSLGIACAVILYLFSARAVEFEVTPSHARLSVAGLWTPRVGKRWLLLPGAHRLDAYAEGYRPLDVPIEVGRAPHQKITVSLRPLPGQLAVDVSPVARAEVLVDGQPAGEVPGEIAGIEAGIREITVRAPRYLDFVNRMEIIGKGQTQTLVAALAPAWAAFTLDSRPAGARVTVDKTPLGTTPLQGELLQGTRQITVRLAGYKDWTRRLHVTAGQAIDIPDVRLEKADGYLKIVSEPPGAAVTVDGAYQGQSPVRLAVAPGRTHKVAVIKGGFLPGESRAEVASGEEETLRVVLAPELAAVLLETTPADAELILDGAPHGAASQQLELTTVEHEIIVRKPGYATWRTTVTPRRGVVKRLRIRLKTAEEMAREEAASLAAARPQTATTSAPSAPTAGMDQSSDVAQQNAALMSSALGLPPPPMPSPAATRYATEGVVHSSLGQELRIVRGGNLTLGNAPVELARPFYLGLREVSNGEFRRFLATHHAPAEKGQNLDGDHLPVVGIRWESAAAYCNWLSRRDSLPPFYQIRFGKVLGIHPESIGYRLPSEAEWEFAARITPDNEVLEFAWPGGFPPRGRHGNYADEAAQGVVPQIIAGYQDGFAGAAPVGSFPANLRGFHDLSGNVSEWVHDFSASLPTTAQRDPLGPPAGDTHVVRGASWVHGDARHLRLEWRDSAREGRRDLGFRLARYAE
jgi:formylglycine-generating enzyme required for sulfatase activity